MALVFFSSRLQQCTGGLSQLELEAEDYRHLVALLGDRFVGIDKAIEQQATVAIDGDIIHDPLLEKLTATSEVHFIDKIRAG